MGFKETLGNIGLGMLGNVSDMFFGGKMMDLQAQKQKELAEHQQKLQMENWKNTNYNAQVEQLKKAGLNVGLMYDGGGAGGVTAGGSSGSVGMASVGGGAQMMLQASKQKAEIDLIKAQTNNLNAQANKTLGVDTELVKTQIDGNKIQNLFNTENYETAIEKSKAELENTEASTNKLVQDGKISEIDAQTRNWKNVAEIFNTMINTDKASEEIKQNWAKVNQGYEQLQQGWKDLKLKERSLDQKDKEIAIQKELQKATTFKAETERNYPGIWNVAGKTINDGIKTIQYLFGGNPEGAEETTTKVK